MRKSPIFVAMQLCLNFEKAVHECRRKLKTVLVAYNEEGYRIGETHHRAHIPDAVVDQIRDRHEYDHVGYIGIAKEFGLSKNTVRKICTYERRAQTPVRWKRVELKRNVTAHP